ncbi:hypothetical protein AgCh_026361 [Apium graveolens]
MHFVDGPMDVGLVLKGPDHRKWKKVINVAASADWKHSVPPYWNSLTLEMKMNLMKINKKKMSVKLSENVLVEVVGTRSNGAPIQAKSNNLISYDLDTHEPYDFVESRDRLSPFYHLREGSISPFLIRSFVETLALLDID